MHKALPSERNEVGLGRAPGGEGVGPLGRAAHVERGHTGLDRRAVHDPGRQRREIAARDGEHRLVEPLQTPPDVPEGDLGLTNAHEPPCQELPVARSAADVDHLDTQQPGRLEILPQQRLEVGGDQAEAPATAVRRRVRRQVLGPGKPTAGVGNLAAQEQDDAQPHRAPRRVLGTASRLMHGVRPLPRLLARLLLTDQVRRNGEPLEIVGLEAGRVEGDQFGVRVTPRPTNKGLPGPLHCSHRRQSRR